MCLPHFLLVHLKYDECPAEKKMLCTLKQKCKTTLGLFETRLRGNNALAEFSPGEQLGVPMSYFLLEVQV